MHYAEKWTSVSGRASQIGKEGTPRSVPYNGTAEAYGAIRAVSVSW